MVTSQLAYLAFLGLLAAERIGELVLSRRNAARALARGAVETGRAHYRVMAGFHTLFLVACALEASLLPRAFPGVLGWIALTLALAAQALRYWAIATLGDRWNVRVIVLPGEPPVVAGPYRWVRHPNYIAVALEMIAVPLVHGAWLTAIVATLGNAMLMWVRIRVEERALGAPYAAAFTATPRFVPSTRGRGSRAG